MAFSTPESQALVIVTQLHIQHLIRELQLVYLNSLLDFLDGHLDVRHVVFEKLITSLLVLFLETSIAFRNVLMTQSSSGDLPLSFLNSQTFCERILLSACCTAFSARTNLSPTFTNTRFQHELFHLDNSHRILKRVLLHCSHSQTTIDRDTNFSTCLSLAMLFFVGPWVPSLAVFFFRPFGTCFIKPTTHSLCVSSSLLVNLPLTHWLTASPPALLPVVGCDRVSVSCSKHALQNASLASL